MGKGTSSNQGNYSVARDYQKSESYLKPGLESKSRVYSSIPVQKQDYHTYGNKSPISNLLCSLNSLIGGKTIWSIKTISWRIFLIVKTNSALSFEQK